MSYLTQLLSGYRQGLARDLTQSAEAIRDALAGEDNPARRGTLLGLLAQSIAQQDRQLPNIDEPTPAQLLVTEPSPSIELGASSFAA